GLAACRSTRSRTPDYGRGRRTGHRSRPWTDGCSVPPGQRTVSVLGLAGDGAVGGQVAAGVVQAGSGAPAVQLHQPGLDHLQAVEEAGDLLVAARYRPGAAHPRAQL